MKIERIIVLLFVTAGVFFVGLKTIPRSSNNELLSDMFWIKKTNAPQVYDMVFIGDSRVYRGLDPTTISKLNGNLKGLNFGYSSGGFSDLLIDGGINKLSPQGKKIIVFGISMFSITPVACKNDHYIEQLNRRREEIVEAYYFSELKYFFRPVDPQFILKNKYVNEKNFELDSNYYHQEPHDNGWQGSWKLRHDYKKALEEYNEHFKNNIPTMSIINNLSKRVGELTKKGYTIIGLRVPIEKSLYELEQSYGGNLFETMKKKFIAAGGNWIELPLTTDGTFDGSHLDKWAAYKLSKDVGEKIHELLNQKLRNK